MMAFVKCFNVVNNDGIFKCHVYSEGVVMTNIECIC